jgi:fermentation-respiration switch protein FrsA (DUF1100 family)
MKKSWRDWARLGCIYTVGVLVVLAVVMVVIGSIKLNEVIRPPRRVSSGSVLMQWNIKYQSVDLLTDDGIHLSAWYTPPRNGAVILVAHSFRDHRPEWVYQMLVRKGYGVLAWDARAHGKSGGEISTMGYSEVLDVKAALKYMLAQPGIEHIGAWGGSMGGATMIRATAQFPEIEALFVDSSFASLSEEFDFLIPYPLMSPLAKVLMQTEIGINVNDVDLMKDIAKISPRPVFVAQGIEDTVAPPDSAEKLFNAAGKPRYLWTEKGIAHLGLYFNNPRRYQRRLVDFFDQWLLKKKT